MTVRFNMPRASAFDVNGDPRSGAKLYFYEPSTTTPKDVYSDSGLTTPISQPVVASSAGLWATIYMQASTYRVICKDSSDVTIWDEDNYDPGLGAGFGVSSTVAVAQGGTGATNAASARSNLGAASAASLTSVQDTVTEHETFIDSARNVGVPTRAGLLAPEDEVTRALLASGFGLITVQESRDDTPNNSTTSTTTPAWDTSIPQVGEGTQIFSAAITPTSASNVLEIHCHLQVEVTSATIVAALFKDSDGDAIAAATATTYGAGVNPTELNIYYRVSAGSTAARTYSVRLGTSAGTARVNASGGTGTLGGVMTSFLSIKEIQTV